MFGVWPTAMHSCDGNAELVPDFGSWWYAQNVLPTHHRLRSLYVLYNNNVHKGSSKFVGYM